MTLVLPYTHRSPRNRGASRFALCGVEVDLSTDAKMTRKDDEVDCPRCREAMAMRVELMMDMREVGSRSCPACKGSKEEAMTRRPCRECAALGRVPADAEREEIGEALRMDRRLPRTLLGMNLDRW